MPFGLVRWDGYIPGLILIGTGDHSGDMVIQDMDTAIQDTAIPDMAIR